MTGPAFPPQQQEPPGRTDAMTPVPDHGEESYQGNDRLVGRTALITGGDSGIGRAVALAFAREGADVAFTFQPPEEVDAKETQSLIETAGRRSLPMAVDLRERTACDDVVQRTVAEFGSIDVLVNNAGYQMARDSGLAELSDERLERTFTTNLFALFWLTRAALPHMPEGSSIINNSSIQAYEPSQTLLEYAATKAAINNFTVNLAGELGSRGIRVNAVAPGPIWKPLQPATQTEEKLAHFGQDTPLGRAA